MRCWPAVAAQGATAESMACAQYIINMAGHGGSPGNSFEVYALPAAHRQLHPAVLSAAKQLLRLPWLQSAARCVLSLLVTCSKLISPRFRRACQQLSC